MGRNAGLSATKGRGVVGGADGDRNRLAVLPFDLQRVHAQGVRAGRGGNTVDDIPDGQHRSIFGVRYAMPGDMLRG